MVRILAAIAAGIAAPVAFTIAGLGQQDTPAQGQVTTVAGERSPVLARQGGDPAEGAASESPQASTGEFVYVVQPGDTLSGIAALFSVPIDDLLQANGIDNPEHIVAGHRISVPIQPLDDRPDDGESPAIEEALRQAEAEFGLPRGLLLALAWRESSWRQDAVSPAGAIGLTQVLPATADWVHERLLDQELDWRHSAAGNASMGAAYLRFLLDRAEGDVWLALAAYYQGWRGIEVYGPHEGTRAYVNSVLALVSSYQ